MSALWQIWKGDALSRLRDIPDGAIQCAITSPPYYGLRDYGTAEWEGEGLECDHLAPAPGGTDASGLGDFDNNMSQESIEKKMRAITQQYRVRCPKCGATRVDKQIGLEEHPDEYVDRLVEVFREVHRTLADDGVLWLNLGDSYASHGGRRGAGKGPNLGGTAQAMRGQPQGHRLRPAGYKRKDLLGVPWMVAFALRNDGWFLRSETIWQKPNAMPESVKDRPSVAHEQLFLLSKSRHYHYDHEAIREPDKGLDHPRKVLSTYEPSGGIAAPNRGIRTAGGRNGNGRNKRSVWTVSTVPFKGAHYATFPPKLIEPCVLAGAARGQIVLDPFAGSGVTVMVAARHHRRAIGIELGDVELARTRVSEYLRSQVGSTS